VLVIGKRKRTAETESKARGLLVPLFPAPFHRRPCRYYLRSCLLRSDMRATTWQKHCQSRGKHDAFGVATKYYKKGVITQGFYWFCGASPLRVQAEMFGQSWH